MHNSTQNIFDSEKLVSPANSTIQQSKLIILKKIFFFCVI